MASDPATRRARRSRRTRAELLDFLGSVLMARPLADVSRLGDEELHALADQVAEVLDSGKARVGEELARVVATARANDIARGGR